uniref:TIR domain-containing protein n=1 Tax=Cyprinodon variegatus TaxID=28743 RepID=A0A3Q2CH26_CYPVA
IFTTMKKNMAAAESYSSYLILQIFCLLLCFNPSLAFALKKCTILYQENLSNDLSLDCANKKLVTIPDEIPKDAVLVKLNSNQLKRINKGDFLDMSKLKILDVGENNISDVDEGSFKDLVILATLRIASNTLTNLPKNIFQGLSNLISLDLSHNRIQFIHELAFQDLTSLKTLDLDYNKLQQIVHFQPIFQLPHIQRVNLSHNSFLCFNTTQLFRNLSSNLEELILSTHKMKTFSISTPVFPNLKKLVLYRSHSALRWKTPDKTLLRNITHLYISQPVLSLKRFKQVLQNLESLSNLRLNYLDKYIKDLLSTVCKLQKLRKLDLFHTYLNSMTLKLAPCSQLTELNLTQTYINELPNGSIQTMKNLVTLSLSTNTLVEVPYDIRTLSNLQILNIEFNLISHLSCEDFINTTSLRELSLYSNCITKLKRCVFENVKNLKLLNLSKNQLRTIRGTFNVSLHRLEVLDISDNKIMILETGCFQVLQSLRHLNTASNIDTTIKRETFKGLSYIQVLVVSLTRNCELNVNGLEHLENITIYLVTKYASEINQTDNYTVSYRLKSVKRITFISRVDPSGSLPSVPIQLLQPMKQLQHFTAVNVHINAVFANIFQFNPQLKSMTFVETDMSNLNPNLFQDVPKLQALDLSKCKIKDLDFIVQSNLSALRYLKLTENKITVINETVFQYLPFLTYLDLSNNPFSCECSNAGFIRWAKDNKQTQVANTSQYICEFPLPKQGSLLLDFDILSCRDDGTFFCFISSTCLVVLTLLIPFIHHYLRWKLGYTFHLFLAFLYDSKKRKKGDSYRFDAFVSYNINDEDWVYREMLPMLEEKQGWRLCLHHRDFQPGKPIIENITDAIYSSRKTICVISRSYLQSEWCSREIQMASFRLFDEKRDVLILLFLEEIPGYLLSPYFRMRKLVKKRTYLSWPQAAHHPGVFWQMVQRALHTRNALTENTNRLTGPTGH